MTGQAFPQETVQPRCQEPGGLRLSQPRHLGPGTVPDVNRLGCPTRYAGHRYPYRVGAGRAVPHIRGGVAGKLLKKLRGRRLATVEHIQADVDLRGPAGNTVLHDGQAFGQPSDMVQPERGVEKCEPDDRTVMREARRCAWHWHGRDCLTKTGNTVHPHSSPCSPCCDGESPKPSVARVRHVWRAGQYMLGPDGSL